MRDWPKISRWTKAAVLGSLLVFGMAQVCYAYYTWIGLHLNIFTRLWVPSLEAWMPPSYVTILASLILISLITFKAADIKISRLAEAMLAGSLTVSGSFLISIAYFLSVYYFLDQSLGPGFGSFSDKWLPLYLVTGLASFIFGLLMAYKAANRQMPTMAKITLPAILIATGSLLLLNAYDFTVLYYRIEVQVKQRLVYDYLLAYQSTYALMPLFLAVALITVTFGLLVAYRMFKAPNSHEGMER